MKLLVTGATGFTGQHFVRMARAAQHEVIECKIDLRDRDRLHSFVAQAAPEMVVHLAGVSFIGHADPSAFYTVHVIGTLNLLDALAALPQPPQNILLTSSANVYGNRHASPIAEDQPLMPAHHYGASKLAMECLAREYLDRLSLFFVRPFNYTGPGQALSFLIPKLVTHFVRGVESIELGNLDVEREFNDVRFVCEAYLRLLSMGKSGEAYNICSNKPIPLRSVIDCLIKISGHSLDITVNPAYIRANEAQRFCGNPEKLMQEIGVVPLPTLQETLSWMFESYA